MSLKRKIQDAEANVQYYATVVGRAKRSYTKRMAVDNLVAAVKERDRLSRLMDRETSF